ncbi:zinc finger protein 32-like isoform X2 [Maniola hyperantus]|uniref:zinc finger protein 32-like isoform X2 n=1 Tax=Aphantopus hyperantus TaxID=2795564 RepID=UPI00156A39C8|nr:zinc finger protein 32-like [Maniola hyperantus]
MLPTFLLLNHMATRRRNLRKTMKTVKIEWENLDVNYCRCCLATEDLVPIFYNNEGDKKRSEDLKVVTGLEIKLNDGLTQTICRSCIEKMQAALLFRQTSRKSEKTLLSMLYVKSKRKYKPKSSRSIQKFKEEQVAEVADGEYGCDDHLYEDAENFHKDTDYLYDNNEYADPAALPVKIEQKVPSTRRKRDIIPNAPSYKCNTCNKEFRMKTTYKAHMRFHTNYCVCETCGKRCRNNNQLQEHKRARHGLGRIHKCAYCEYSSATKEALIIHERRHTGERPYICDHCGATFHRRSNLVQHIAIHLPEKNFQCDMCPKKLKSRKFLQIHKHNAHTGKRYGYLCSVCEHRFEKPNKVRAHARRVHALTDEQIGPIVRVQL